VYLRARLALDERGASLVEYALLVGLIAMVCFAAVVYFGGSLSGRYSNITSSVGP
jgi:Flp pilus assembly pilin Flp